ncbi:MULTISPECIES: MATE family efflux transporter [unclassified Cupriavidus]|uniref:MATE family efflux transporter n=1 Tax=unclassified Cupriavidus TaxID=2640874 RepID=UPI001BFFE24C|nr:MULTISPECIES: MATE family efflux transporter [unclassified Cupriavidus]MCA3182270.1 MATE family efflux transporter [Cupriavidus sp.]MCA3188777.1 MATE family efflux transporter [Cupriavidus sp.]MCA3198497.1 MATE family efflux transporter [Cupriavidus sp.]MCA3201243.1 MATE family efflux transporter [Cupriavidus sp.]MCA3208986.1 MATE family efflux transporter [Cupriavidus sp.]
MKPDARLTTGPIGRTLLMFSLPVLGSNILQSLNASINSVWVGRYLGEAALTATSNANIILFFLLGVVFGISMANTIMIGQAIGARDIDEARRVVGTSTTFFVGLSVLASAFGFAFTPEILAAMQTPHDAAPLAVIYLRIIFVALPFMYFYNFVMMTLRGAGDSRTPFYFMLLSAVLDVVLNPVLIFGVGPLPALGIAGSALATLIAQLTSLAAMLVLLYRRKHFLLLHRTQLALLKPDTAILKALVAKGLPMGLQMVVISSSAIVMMSMVNGYGSQTTAAYGVASQLWTYVQMPALAVGASVSSMVAQNVGAGLWARVSRITQVGLLFNVLMTGALVGLVYLFNRHSLGIFLGDDSVAIEIAQHINLVVLWSFILFGFTIVVFGTVRATGAVMAPLVILFISMWVIRLPFAWALGPRIGAESIWWSFPLGSVVSVVLAFLYYRFGNWKRSHILPATPHPQAVGQAPDTSMGCPCEDVDAGAEAAR